MAAVGPRWTRQGPCPRRVHPWPRLSRPVPLREPTEGPRQEGGGGQGHDGEPLHTRPEVLLVVCIERGLVCGGEQVRAEYVGVLHRDPGRLHPPAEDPRWVLEEELVERVAARDVHGEGRVLAASSAAPLLPYGGDAPRVSATHHGVKRPDVNSELQSVRGDDAEEVAAEETAFDLSSLPRGVASAVGGDPTRPFDAEPVGGVAVDELGSLPRPGESYGPDPLRDEVREDQSALGQKTPPLPLLLVEQGRVAEDDPPLARGSAVVIHEGERYTREALGKLLRVGYRGAREDEAGIAAVQPRHPPEPPEDGRHVRPEDAAQDVSLVDGHDLEVA